MAIYFVSRHPGAHEWAARHGFAGAEVITHLDPDIIDAVESPEYDSKRPGDADIIEGCILAGPPKDILQYADNAHAKMLDYQRRLIDDVLGGGKNVDR